MATLRISDEVEMPPETAVARSERVAAERAMIEEAREDIAAGRVIDDTDLDAWLADLLRGNPVDLPEDAPTYRAR